MTLPPDVRAWPEDAVDELRERAAIMEVLGRGSGSAPQGAAIARR